jgi:hypothetical protein
MAGDWIKMRIDLPDDPAVILISSRLGIPRDAVVGKLLRLWGWASRNTTNGCALGATELFVDELTSAAGFAAAMRAATWLKADNESIEFPKFDTHMSQSAKRRAVAKNVMQKIRCASRATKAQPEKRREEKILTTTKKRTKFVAPSLEEVKAHFSEVGTKINPVKFHAYYEARAWKGIKDWKHCRVTWEQNEFDLKPESSNDWSVYDAKRDG